MAKVTITGDAMVITAEFTTKELKLVEKRRPEVLTLYDMDHTTGAKSPIFKVGTSKGRDVICSVGNYGITFPSLTRDDDAKASITVLLNSDVTPIEGDIREYVADVYGTAITNLGDIETLVANAVEGIKADTKELLESITLV